MSNYQSWDESTILVPPTASISAVDHMSSSFQRVNNAPVISAPFQRMGEVSSLQKSNALQTGDSFHRTELYDDSQIDPPMNMVEDMHLLTPDSYNKSTQQIPAPVHQNFPQQQQQRFPQQQSPAPVHQNFPQHQSPAQVHQQQQQHFPQQQQQHFPQHQSPAPVHQQQQSPAPIHQNFPQPPGMYGQKEYNLLNYPINP